MCEGRWLQFSLRGLLIFVAGFAILLSQWPAYIDIPMLPFRNGAYKVVTIPNARFWTVGGIEFVLLSVWLAYRWWHLWRAANDPRP
jgi:hypothetical protein